MRSDKELIAEAETLVDEKTLCDAFENAIRKFGIINACEWFGFSSESDFTQGTILALSERNKC